ncbi:nucleoside transporter C-terminal domain-containing protein [Dickeya fangzhongdai]|uniref:nucleoside transporter C-terminal domain-containing protein n=1 Tax=Dickeya fangzhongdai TaxID=1778540 RepID=UPI000EAEB515
MRAPFSPIPCGCSRGCSRRRRINPPDAAAILLAFIALVALLYGILGDIGDGVNDSRLSIKWMLGWVFSPLAAVGVSPDAFTFSRRYIVLFTGGPARGRLTPGCRVQ